MRRAICLILMLSVLSLPVSAAYPSQLTPVGSAVALELRTDGVYLSGFAAEQSPAEQAGLQEGDRFLSVNGTRIESPEQLGARIRQSQGARLFVRVLRNGAQMSFTVLPEYAGGSWRIGVLARDTIRGIGTVTFIDRDTGLFGALGHGVNGKAWAQPLAVSGGSASRTRVVQVIRGEKGKPGALCGAEEEGAPLGSVERSTAAGVFGHWTDAAELPEPLPLGSARDVRTGEAEILCSVRGSSTERFRVELKSVDEDAEDGRNLLLRVADERLLAQTGGIVQGMSGSPILQDGKLIGAVTHVLVRDPTEGYGILIGNMLEASQAYDAA